MKLFRNFSVRKLQFVRDKIDGRLDVGQVSRIRHDRFDRNVIGKDFVVYVEDNPALGEDWLFDDVFLSRQTRVLVVLDHLKVDQAE
jgi:hypothetical protein